VEVIVQIRRRTTTAHGAGDVAPPRLFNTLEEEFGVTLQPLHPGVQDPTLGAYYHMIADEAVALEVITRLRASSRIEAVYVKPAAEAPSP